MESITYGDWPSPLSAAMTAAAGHKFSMLRVHGDAIYWLAARPLDAGRQVLQRTSLNAQGQVETLTPEGFSVHSRVHEYGGGDYWLGTEGVFFVNDADQRVYWQHFAASPEPVTAASEARKQRYADGVQSPDGRFCVCVQETHRSAHAVDNNLVVFDANARDVTPSVLTAGHDFYANPCFDATGQRLAWITWDQPNMPWDGSSLWVADFSDGCVSAVQRIAGGDDESIFQPMWRADGALCFASDRSGWWNIYAWQSGEITALAPMSAECGQPLWVFGMRAYDLLADGSWVCIVGKEGRETLQHHYPDGRYQALDLPYSQYHCQVCALGHGVVSVASSATVTPEIVYRSLADDNDTQVVVPSQSFPLPQEAISAAESIYFESNTGKVHAFYYAPKNPEARAPEGTLPPLIVMSHGGPTSAARHGLSAAIQFWTSRGFAVVDVNYGGSTGFGRAYRQRLQGQWGVVDVEDCIQAAQYLVAEGRVDAMRLFIRGGSAAGFTTLCALVGSQCFTAGASYYGVADLEILAGDTHKFEARYLDGLVGPYPEQRALYQARSPLHAFSQLNCPLIIFQGLQDKVVPPSQAEAMVAVLKEKNLPYEYVTFADEAHGFRAAAAIEHALSAELAFYQKSWREAGND